VFGEKNIIDNFSLIMSTISSGGFVPNSTILQDLLWQEHLVLIAGMILAALPFTFHYAFVRKKFIPPKLGTEVLVYFAILGGAVAIFAAVSEFEPITAAFLTVSASTTSGLQPGSLAGLGAATQTILIILMLVGGCGFSTAGGIKIFRFLHLQNLRKALNFRDRKTLSSETKKDVATSVIVLILFPLIASLTALHFVSTTDAPFGDAFLEATAVITTGGLQSGVITIDYDPATKVGLSMLMIIGRLEIIAIFYIFVPKLSTT
jgi:trk system potassium uptake protein TrkH